MHTPDKQSDRELWNPLIDWFLNVAPSELGAKGTLDGVIAALEHGGQVSGVPDTTPFSNRDLGWAEGGSPSEKWRRCAPVWFALGQEAQGVMLAHYQPRNDLPSTQRVAVAGELAKLANASLWIHTGEQLVKLIEACVDKEREGRKQVIAAAMKRTEKAVRNAHRLWGAILEIGAPAPVPAISLIPPPCPAKAAKWEADYAMRQNDVPRAAEYAGALALHRFARALRRHLPEARAARAIASGCRRLSKAQERARAA